MEKVLSLSHVSKEFKVLNHREGLKGSLRDLFSRDYNIVKAVSDISLDIEQGEIVGYLGPNGAGKSTTIKMMTGVLEPTSGEILVNGKVPYKNRTANAQNIGVVFGQRTQLWWSLPVIESFKILRDMYQVSEKDFKAMMELYAGLVDIEGLLHKPVRQMSLGQRTLSDILAAFLHNPSVVFLDEPTIGLDVSMKSKIRELIMALNQEKQTTVILTTHDMGDVDALCRRIVIIDKGKMLYDNDIEQLRGFFGAYRTLKLRLDENASALTEEALEKTTAEVEAALKQEFSHASSLSVSAEEEWVDILINEDEVELMKVMNFMMGKRKIYDMK
ncbi:MAG: ATP-binding cassette domain-containing protein, partial [Bacillota bacterium]|nr:ATP-binding cassette domain-containing protein [Bacillota bacterium]